MIGFAALGKEIQEIIHNIYGFEEPIGWRYQIKNSIALNYLVEITRKIGKEQHRFSDAFYSYGFSVGTIHTHTNVSLSGRIGLKELANFKNSIAFGTHLSSTQKRKIESFLHWKINSKIVVYDATMQGNLFDNKSPVTFTPNRFQFLFELGYKFTANRWNFGYKAVYQTNERSNLVFDNGHFYGSLFISKLFK